MTLMELLQKSVQIIEEQAAARGLTGSADFDILLIVGAIENEDGGTLMASTNLPPDTAKALAQYFADTCQEPTREYPGPVKAH